VAVLRAGYPLLLHQQRHQFLHVLRQRSKIPPRIPQHVLLCRADQTRHDKLFWNGRHWSSEHDHDLHDPGPKLTSSQPPLHDTVCMRCFDTWHLRAIATLCVKRSLQFNFSPLSFSFSAFSFSSSLLSSSSSLSLSSSSSSSTTPSLSFTTTFLLISCPSRVNVDFKALVLT